jgi:3-oxoacyl-[acyl-carrier protein] reductase
MKTALRVDSLPGELREQLLSTIPLGRLKEPSDVATAVLFFASDETAFLTGVFMAVDGGRSIS